LTTGTRQRELLSSQGGSCRLYYSHLHPRSRPVFHEHHSPASTLPARRQRSSFHRTNRGRSLSGAIREARLARILSPRPQISSGPRGSDLLLQCRLLSHIFEYWHHP